MADYRFHLLDRTGQVTAVKERTCADDAAALMAATDLLAGFSGVEVWRGNKRMVARVPKRSSSPTSDEPSEDPAFPERSRPASP